jgi:hypothetical protein
MSLDKHIVRRTQEIFSGFAREKNNCFIIGKDCLSQHRSIYSTEPIRKTRKLDTPSFQDDCKMHDVCSLRLLSDQNEF